MFIETCLLFIPNNYKYFLSMRKHPFQLSVAFLNCKLLPPKNPRDIKFIIHIFIWLNPAATHTMPEKVIRMIRIIYIYHLWRTRFCIKCFMSFVSFNPHNIPNQGESIISTCQMSEIGLERPSDFPRVSEAILNLVEPSNAPTSTRRQVRPSYQ